MSNSVRRGRGRPPAAVSADTPGRIVRAAQEVFGEVGYDAATFQAIADRADLTRPAINHHFASKRELYQRVVEQTNNTLIEASIAEARRHDGFAERIHAFITSAQTHTDRPAASFVLTSVLESQRHPELADDEHDALTSTRAFVGWALNEAKSAGELRPDIDVDTVTETVLAMLLGMGFYTGFVGESAGRTDIGGEFLRLLRGDGL